MPQRERKKNYDVNEYYRDVLGQVCSIVGRASLICTGPPVFLRVLCFPSTCALPCVGC